jgi:hypothetical protein
VQSLRVTAVPDAPEHLVALAERVLAGEVEALTVAPDVRLEPVLRGLALLHALDDAPHVAGVTAGDGADSATFAVRAGTTWWRLEVTGSDPVTDLVLTACPTAEHAWLEHRFG